MALCANGYLFTVWEEASTQKELKCNHSTDVTFSENDKVQDSLAKRDHIPGRSSR
jgi:hypothetical protein